MKRLLHSVSSVLMLVVLLGTTTGMQLYTHVCQTAGTSEVSIQEIHSCCTGSDATSAATMLNSDCCESGVSYLKLDIPAWQPDLDFQVTVNQVTLGFPFSAIAEQVVAVSGIQIHDPPPPYPADGRERTYLFQVFLI